MGREKILSRHSHHEHCLDETVEGREEREEADVKSSRGGVVAGRCIYRLDLKWARWSQRERVLSMLPRTSCIGRQALSEIVKEGA